jgi:hypothetical protein
MTTGETSRRAVLVGAAAAAVISAPRRLLAMTPRCRYAGRALDLLRRCDRIASAHAHVDGAGRRQSAAVHYSRAAARHRHDGWKLPERGPRGSLLRACCGR